MSKPYFYIIQHIPSQKYYAGCKINFSADPSNLMTQKGYKTTSKIVKKLIEKDGLDSFIILKIKLFKSPSDALYYESRFLKKVNAAENIKFINLHNGGKNFVNKGGYKLSESTKNKMRKPKSKETIEKQKESLKNRTKESYQKSIETRKKNGKSWISEEQREKMKSFNASHWCDQNRENHSDIMIDYYKNNPVSEETKIKQSKKSKGDRNGMFGKTHNESTREKMKLAWEKRKNKN